MYQKEPVWTIIIIVEHILHCMPFHLKLTIHTFNSLSKLPFPNLLQKGHHLRALLKSRQYALWSHILMETRKHNTHTHTYVCTGTPRPHLESSRDSEGISLNDVYSGKMSHDEYCNLVELFKHKLYLK